MVMLLMSGMPLKAPCPNSVMLFGRLRAVIEVSTNAPLSIFLILSGRDIEVIVL